jgi:hypothetical protein
VRVAWPMEVTDLFVHVAWPVEVTDLLEDATWKTRLKVPEKFWMGKVALARARSKAERDG